MSQRTQEIAREVRFETSAFPNVYSISSIFKDIQSHLQANKFDAGNNIVHYGLVNKEIPDFLRDVFPEIKNIKVFLKILGIFGLKRGLFNKDFFNDAFVLFDREKSGFVMIQQPLGQLNTFEKSQFCLMYRREEDGNPILNITGVNDGRILAAEYRFKPSENGYVRTNLDIGVEQNELKKYLSQPITALQYGLENRLLITQEMLKKAPLHEYILCLGNQSVPNLSSLSKLAGIHQKILTK